MSRANIRLTIRAIDNFTSAIIRVRESFLRWYWITWWTEWGTEGWKRKRALVVVDDGAGTDQE
jgi:hypothetical protein